MSCGRRQLSVRTEVSSAVTAAPGKMSGAPEEANPLQRVPSTPTSASRWLNPLLSPTRSISLSPSRMRKPPLSDGMGRHASVSPRRFKRDPSSSPAPRDRADRRQKLEEYNSLDDAVRLLKESIEIVVLSGAGISTSIGIPDFRSKQGMFLSLRDHAVIDMNRVVQSCPGQALQRPSAIVLSGHV